MAPIRFDRRVPSASSGVTAVLVAGTLCADLLVLAGGGGGGGGGCGTPDDMCWWCAWTRGHCW